MPFLLGIDPGLSGALALLDPVTHELIVEDMPTHQIKVGASMKNQIDLYQLGRIIDNHSTNITAAIIESVTASPQMGVTSAFTFGFGAGAVQACVAANFIPMHRVIPRVWKKDMKLNASKDASRQKASELFPRSAGLWSRAKDDGRAEAALIAYYGMRFLDVLS